MAPEHSAALRWTTRAAAGSVFTFGFMAFVVWTVSGGSGWLLPSQVHVVQPESALVLALTALCALVPDRAARTIGTVVAAICVLVLAEYAVAAGPTLDRLLDSSPDPVRNRMSALTAAAVLALAGAQFVRKTVTGDRIVHTVAAGVAAFGYCAVVVHLFADQPLASISSLSTLPAAAALLLLAYVLAARVDGGFVFWLTDAGDSGSRLMRRLIPIGLAVPFVNFAVRRARLAGWLTLESAGPVASLAVAALLIVTVALAARELRRADRQRRSAATALRVVNEDLERRVLERAGELDSERSINAVLVDRERIAADLHDLVVQRLYAAALDLQAKAARGTATLDVDPTLDAVDDAIADLRRTIFDLRNRPSDADFAALLEQVAAESAHAFVAAPTVTIHGDVHLLPGLVAIQLVAVAREAMSNAARHAAASRADISVEIDAAGVTLAVADDGCGIAADVVSTSGVRNMQRRAAQLDGWCAWTPTAGGGTTVTWFAPRAAAGETVDRPDTDAALNTRLIDSMRALGEMMLADPGRDHLDTVTASLFTLVRADYAVEIVAAERELRFASTIGFTPDNDPIGGSVPRGTSLAGYAIDTREPVRVDEIDDVGARVNNLGEPLHGPVLIVPVCGAVEAHASITLARRPGRAPFTQAEEDAALALATFAALEIDLRSTARPAAGDDTRTRRRAPHATKAVDRTSASRHA